MMTSFTSFLWPMKHLANLKSVTESFIFFFGRVLPSAGGGGAGAGGAGAGGAVAGGCPRPKTKAGTGAGTGAGAGAGACCAC